MSRKLTQVVVAGLAIVLAFAGCTASTESDGVSIPYRNAVEFEMFNFADRHLPDDELADAVPTGFELDAVVRNDMERNNGRHITVGVRMDGPVYARAIFYVLPNAARAATMYRDQVHNHSYAWRIDRRHSDYYRGKLPRPWSPGGAGVPTRCAADGSSLFWCHAVKGRVYLAVQSSAGRALRDGTPTAEQRGAASALTRAFGGYLGQAVPSE